MTTASGPDGPPHRDISSTFFKGLQVLSAFDDDHPRLTMAEIGQITGLDRAAVRRLMITLVAFGYVQKTGKHYGLLPKILTLTGSYMRGNAMGTVVQPILNRHSKDLLKEISLAARADTEAVYIAKSILSDADISFGFTVGSRLPILQTAIGRMLLATCDDATLSQIVRTAPLRPYTAQSLMDREAILSKVQDARAQGYALVDNEFEAGVAGLAVPVGPVAGATMVIGVSVPLARLTGTDLKTHALNTLQQCANELVRSRTGV
ncbi:IclR family transcriptional regulator domain-containing protein [Pseudosulfitobacter koreensis]|uniref:Helix-turn-helix domain-containing protein n=1 Tax=Pseudosulfitobacter koreensis TaxID=2968472 RepID=A0ABT1Z300_9RHOB|nr:helix-turn-helix domain-containing protein [Pseudosulfitobacter koreense]